MNRKFFRTLLDWPKPYISGTNLLTILDKSEDSRNALIKRAVKEGLLIRLRRDFFVIQAKLPIDSFEVASILYGPSYVSLESALQFHGWIPEAVPVTACITTKRSKEFDTPIGPFSYHHIPVSAFHMGVNQLQRNLCVVFIADPWKAVADMIYVQHRCWKKWQTFCEDMRVEEEKITDFEVLEYLSQNYPNNKVKQELRNLYDSRHH